MRLETLYPNFLLQPPEAQAQHIALYRAKRAVDFEITLIKKGKKRTVGSSETSKNVLSEEEKSLMLLLGLKQKDMIALRALKEDIVVEEDTEADIILLQEDITLEEEEE